MEYPWIAYAVPTAMFVFGAYTYLQGTWEHYGTPLKRLGSGFVVGSIFLALFLHYILIPQVTLGG